MQNPATVSPWFRHATLISAAKNGACHFS